MHVPSTQQGMMSLDYAATNQSTATPHAHVLAEACPVPLRSATMQAQSQPISTPTDTKTTTSEPSLEDESTDRLKCDSVVCHFGITHDVHSFKSSRYLALYPGLRSPTNLFRPSLRQVISLTKKAGDVSWDTLAYYRIRLLQNRTLRT